MTNQQAPEIYTLHTAPNKGERPWSGIYAVRADAEHDAKVLRDATGRDWSVVRLVVADANDRVPEAWTNLLAYVLQDELHNRLTPRVIDIAYAAFMQAKRPYDEDGGASDWFNDTRPMVREMIAKLRKDLVENLAGDASKNGVKLNMSTQQPAPATQQVGDALGYTTGITWTPHQSEQVKKITRYAQPEYGYNVAIYTAPQPSPTPQTDSQPAHQRDTGYPPLPECDATTVGLGAVWNRHSMRAYVDADRTARTQADSVCYDYAKQIAESMWATHYKADAPHWESCDSLMGVLSQISNMMRGLSRAPADSVTAPAAYSGNLEQELAMLIRRIVSSARRNCEDGSNVLKLANEAWAYLVRKGLNGSPLRDAGIESDPTPPAQTADSVLEDAGGANWQDISTAPKDGTRFVAVGNNYGLCSETQHTCIAQWFRGCWMEVSDWNDASELKYLTHWMPLPPLPGSAASATADSVLEDAARLDWIAMYGSFGVDSATGEAGGNGQKRIAATRKNIDAARKQGANHD